MDSRSPPLRGQAPRNDGHGLRGNAVPSSHSRFRGNDGRGRSGKRRADHHSRFRGNDRIGAGALRVRCSDIRDRRTPMDSGLRENNGNSAGNVIPAKAGIHAALTEDECLYRKRGRG